MGYDESFTIKTLNFHRVYVSQEEWDKLDIEVKVELIALSRMTGEEIQAQLNDEEQAIYDKAMGFEE